MSFNPDHLTEGEKDTIVHAAAMGGWLTASYFALENSYGRKLPGCLGPVFDLVTGGGPTRYVLTGTGRTLARQLATANPRSGPERVCPECGEAAVHCPPDSKGTGSLAGGDPARQEWSHLDGEPLCPVVTDTGYQPALPTRIDPPSTSTGTTASTSTAPSPSRTTLTKEAPMTAEEPQDMQELAHYLDTGVEEAEALSERARRLEEIADSDLRLTPRLKTAISEAAGACKLASEAVGELPGTLRSDLDV